MNDSGLMKIVIWAIRQRVQKVYSRVYAVGDRESETKVGRHKREREREGKRGMAREASGCDSRRQPQRVSGVGKPCVLTYYNNIRVLRLRLLLILFLLNQIHF